MTTECSRSFDDSLLTGYLDGALTQGNTQRVRLHLEECAVCRAEVEEMRELREVTMSTRFQSPPDDQWDETPRGGLSRLTRGVGWGVLVIWLVALLGFALGQLWNSPASLVEKLLVFGGVAGVALVFVSVLVDRLRTRQGDRYRRVPK